MWSIKHSTILGVNSCSMNILDGAVEVTTTPLNGVCQSIDSIGCKGKITLNNIKGSSFLNIKNKNTKVNYLFNKEKIFNYNFKNVRGVFTHRLINNELVRICTVSNVDETMSQGHIIMIDKYGNIQTLYKDSNCQQLISRVERVGNNDVVLYHKLTTVGNSRVCELYALISGNGFKTVTNKKIFNTDYEVQCYFIEVLENNKLILPYMKREVNGNSDKCSIDMAICDYNFNNMVQLNQFKTIENRGLLEPKILKVDNDNYTIISRSECGALYTNNFNILTNTIGEPKKTIFSTSSTTFDVLTYNNKNYLAFNNVNPNTTDTTDKNYPRYNIGLCEVNSTLTAFDNYNYIADIETVGGTYTNKLPYIHSPLISIIDDILTVSFEHIDANGSYIESYIVYTDINNLKKEYTHSTLGTKVIEYELPVGNYDLEVLGCSYSDNRFIIEKNIINVLGVSLCIKDKIITIPFSKCENNYIYVKVNNINYKLKLNNSIKEINDGNVYDFKIFIDNKIKTICKIT